MKYIRFTKIDKVTGISNNVKHSVNGLKFPDIVGLELLFQDSINTEFWYGTVPDEYNPNANNQESILSLSELGTFMKTMVEKIIGERKHELYEEEKRVRDILMNGYHTTASIAGLYKYEQAKELLLDENAEALEIRTEAAIRGIAPSEIAFFVIERHETFRQTEAAVAGIRGKLYDRLANFVFDVNDPIASWDEFHSTELVGEVDLPKYGMDIMARLRALEAV